MRSTARGLALAMTAVWLLAAPAAAEFRRAEGNRTWAFPRDHGQHPEYRLEWWYYTGIVRTAQGRTFGYQVTFFRQSIPDADLQRPSAWAARSLYLAHVALSDVKERRYLLASRVGRESLGISGAAADRHQVWLRDWRADALAEDPHGVTLTIDTNRQDEDTPFALQLTLRAERPPVLHGENGLDRKGEQPGQASWYYSLPRLATAGTVRVGGEEHTVTGSTWMDHEFGTSQLGKGVEGWDWLALRLSDGSDLMLYRLRRRDGRPDPASSGTFVSPKGQSRTLTLTGPGKNRADFTPGRTWRSGKTGGTYPLSWQVRVPEANLELSVSAAFDAQEQTPAPGTPFAYWEGVVLAEGTRNGQPIQGEGYLELTGYAGQLGGALRGGGE